MFWDKNFEKIDIEWPTCRTCVTDNETVNCFKLPIECKDNSMVMMMMIRLGGFSRVKCAPDTEHTSETIAPLEKQ